MLFQPDQHLHFENSFVQTSEFFDMQIMVEKKKLTSACLFQIAREKSCDYVFKSSKSD